VEAQKYPAKNPLANARLLTFAKAVEASLPAITEALRAENRSNLSPKQALAVMAQLNTVLEIEHAGPETAGTPAAVNRLIKLGALQEKQRPALFEKIHEARRAIEHMKPAARKTPRRQKRGRSL
jgi:cell division protein ZapA (FtsZ GTPase activity inhibitor)